MNQKLLHLRSILRDIGNAVLAYSGGVDSVFLAAVSVEELGKRVIAVTAVSPSYPSYELEETKKVARGLGMEHILVSTDELNDPNYRANRGDRCYFCKTELYSVCETEAKDRGIPWILNGVNVDDLSDYRPGLQAAKERRVRSPLVEAGLTKAEIRELSRSLGLPTWDKQALACLSSRFPPGTEVTEEKLKRVDAIETELMNLGFKQFRLRFHEPIARIELGITEFERMMNPDVRERVVLVCRENGFLYTTLDLEGFRSGNLNQMLSPLTVFKGA